MAFPLVVRFQDLLRHRVETINRAFQSAISEANYQNVYKGVFPIKVNQLREVVEEIMDAGRPFNFGLEAGSKPELIAALAVHRDPDGLIICNGYKDPTFIKNALLAAARQTSHHGGREAGRGSADFAGLQRDGRHTPQSVCAFVSSRRFGKVGNQRGRKCEVRFVDRRPDCR